MLIPLDEGVQESRKIALCQSDIQNPSKNLQNLQIQSEIKDLKQVHSVLPNKSDQLIISDESTLNIYDIYTRIFQNIFSKFITEIENNGCNVSQIDPHHQNLIVSANDKNQLIVHDLRESKIKYQNQQAHKLQIFDIDFNPNKQYYLMTTSEDGLVKFWDMKRFDHPVKVIDEFVNMPFLSKYNKFHDQLSITSFNDASIQLYRASSVSTAPMDKSLTHVLGGKEDDGLVKIYDEHEESIYSLSWSNSSAWIFASVSYKGNVIVNIVPSSEKFRILL